MGSVSGDARDGALAGGLAETAHDPVIKPRKIVDRCMKNRGYEILSNIDKGA